ISIWRAPSRPSSWMTRSAPSVNVSVMISPNSASPMCDPGSRCCVAKSLIRCISSRYDASYLLTGGSVDALTFQLIDVPRSACRSESPIIFKNPVSDVGSLATEALVQTHLLGLLAPPHRGNAIDDPQHPEGEGKGPNGSNEDGSALHEEEVHVSMQEAVRPGRVERRRGE